MEESSETLVDFGSLAALTSRIFEDQLRMRSAGIEVRGWTPNRETGIVHLRVASDAAEAQKYLDETYGIGRVVAEFAGRPPAPTIYSAPATH